VFKALFGSHLGVWREVSNYDTATHSKNGQPRTANSPHICMLHVFQPLQGCHHYWLFHHLRRKSDQPYPRCETLHPQSQSRVKLNMNIHLPATASSNELCIQQGLAGLWLENPVSDRCHGSTRDLRLTFVCRLLAKRQRKQVCELGAQNTC
jgi:hypothetical protein